MVESQKPRRAKQGAAAVDAVFSAGVGGTADRSHCIAWLGAPQVMGAGYEAMDEAMHGRFSWQFLAMLAVLKIVATLLSFVSGTPGGMFAPTLFIGAILGAAVGGAQHVVLPHLSGSPGTYALVGMRVLFAGFLRAPMTSVSMVLEVSGNSSIILPVIVANTTAYVISRGLQPVAIFDALTRQHGLELPSMEEQQEEGCAWKMRCVRWKVRCWMRSRRWIGRFWWRSLPLPRSFWFG
jgi:hypothetical protein